MAEVRMPKMGDGMEEGTINRWLKKEGDHIASGDSLAEVETDKANVEIPVYESGILTRIVVQVGQTVPVGEVIAHIGAPTTGGNGATSGAVNSGDARGASSGEEAGAAARKPRRAEFRSPSGAPDDASAASAERIKSSPLARKMAGELGIDLARVPGSGPGGRVVERDVTNYMQSHADLQLLRASAAPAPPTPPEPAPAAAAAPPTAPARAFSGTETKPSNMRAAIARRTLQSKQNIPHFYVTMVVEMDRALGMLKELNTDAASGKVTVNDVVIKASAVALGKVPEVNATWTPEGTVRRYTEAHVGMAVGIDEGLIVPVIRDCQTKTLRQISAEARELGAKARKNELKPDEYSGGTFSTSNLGMMGVDEFIAIINPPEAAILAIAGIVREPVVADESSAIVIRARMKVTLSADHRVLDGVLAARFLQEFKKALEAPYGLVA